MNGKIRRKLKLASSFIVNKVVYKVNYLRTAVNPVCEEEASLKTCVDQDSTLGWLGEQPMKLNLLGEA